jgi:hypothetical protein
MPPTFTTLQLKKPNQARVDFRPLEFRRLVLTKGMPMQWEQATRCPCERVIDDGATAQGTGEFQTDCPDCYGRGVVYHSPLVIRALYEDANTNPKRFSVYGETATGMAGVTLLPEHSAGFLDRFTLIENTMRYEETRIRRAVVERMRWPVATRNVAVGGGPDDTLRQVIQVNGIYSRKADMGGNILPPVLESGTDYEITADGQIDWSLGDTLGTSPAIGARYSLSYFGHPTYIVQNFPFTIRDTWIKQKNPNEIYRIMPQRTMCWLEYLGRPEWPQQGVV